MRADQTKASAPAYPGARFNSDGLCINHSDVRLCRFSSDGSVKTIRKICFKCGAGSTCHMQRAKLQGCRKKPSLIPHDEKPRSVTIRLDGRQHTSCDGGHSGHRTGKKAEHRGSQNSPAKTMSARSRRRSVSPSRKGCGLPRGRTISPLRKSPPNESAVRPMSSDEVAKKRITKEKIRELYDLMPPLYQASSNSADSSQKSGQLRSAKSSQHRRSGRQPSLKQKMPFDGKGYCRAHPEVRLAEKDAKGEWNVVSGVCPQCCVSAVLAYKEDQPPCTDRMNLAKKSKATDASDISKKSKKKQCPNISKKSKATGVPNIVKKAESKKSSTKDVDNLIGTLFTMSDESHHIQPTTPSSSYPSSPESVPKAAFSTDYFTSANRNILGLALDIYAGERMMAELNQSCLSEATMKHKNAGFARKSSKGWDQSACKEPPGRRRMWSEQ